MSVKNDDAQRSSEILSRLAGERGVIAAGFCNGQRAVQSAWVEPLVPRNDEIWRHVAETFRLLRMHDLPRRLCEWHFSPYFLLATPHLDGVLGVLCETELYETLQPCLRELLDCEGLPSRIPGFGIVRVQAE